MDCPGRNANDYISNIIVNLEATYNAYYYQFEYYRQKAIINNVTNNKFLGKYWNKNKIFIHGGGYHTPTNFNFPGDGNFYTEGTFLTNDFERTKGKTYSIRCHSFSRSLGNMAETDLDSLLHQGGYYYRMLRSWQKAYKKKLIDKDEYLLDFKMNDMHKLIMKQAILNNSQSMLITKIEWIKILSISKKNFNKLYRNLRFFEDDYIRYNEHIFFPGSPILEARHKK